MTLPYWTPKPGYTSLSLKQIQDEFGCVILTPTPFIPIPVPPFVTPDEPAIPTFEVAMLSFAYNKVSINETTDNTVTFSYSFINRGTKTIIAEMVPIGSITASDFTGSTSYELNTDSGNFSLTAAADNLTEGEEKFKVAFYVKNGKLDPFYTSPVISILDTSLTPPPVLTILPSALPKGKVGVAYTQELTVTGGDGNHEVAQTGGSLPSGLKLEKIGSKYTITGTPTTPGTSSFTLTATGVVDAGIGSAALALTVDPSTLTISPSNLPSGQVSTAYSQRLTATGGNGNYTFSLLSGLLPTGINFITASGTISGTPTGSGGTFPFVVKVVDTNGASGEQSYNLVIASPVSLILSPESLNAAKVGTAYEQIITVSTPSGTTAVPPYTWTVTTGSGATVGVLPTGLSGVVQGTGNAQYKISGTPATGSMATYTLLVSVKDSSIHSGSKSYNLIVTDRDSTVITITGGSTLYYAVHNIPYSEQLTSQGSTGGTITYTLNGTLPPGLTLSSSGLISGIPNLPDTYKQYRFTVQVSDTQRGTGSKVLTITGVKYSIIPASTAAVAGKSLLLDVEGADIEGVVLKVVNPNTNDVYTGSGTPKFEVNNATTLSINNKDDKLLLDQTVTLAPMALNQKDTPITVTAKSSHYNETTVNPLYENTYIQIGTNKVPHTYSRGHTIATINETTAVCERIVTIDTYGGEGLSTSAVFSAGWCRTHYTGAAGSAQSFDTLPIYDQRIDAGGNFSFSEGWVSGYSIQWTGFLLAAHGTGNYTFTASVDDLFAVWIGDRAVSGYDWGNATLVARLKQAASASVRLESGKLYPIRIQFVQTGGPGSYYFTWAPPADPENLITDFSSMVRHNGTCGSPAVRPIITDPYHDAYTAFGKFVKEINDIPNGRIMAITSFDAIQITKPMRSLLTSLGGLSSSGTAGQLGKLNDAMVFNTRESAQVDFNVVYQGVTYTPGTRSPINYDTWHSFLNAYGIWAPGNPEYFNMWWVLDIYAGEYEFTVSADNEVWARVFRYNLDGTVGAQEVAIYYDDYSTTKDVKNTFTTTGLRYLWIWGRNWLGPKVNPAAVGVRITRKMYSYTGENVIETQDVNFARTRHTFVGKKTSATTATGTVERLGVSAGTSSYSFTIRQEDTVNLPSQTVQFAIYGTYKTNNNVLFARSSSVTISPTNAALTLQVAAPTIITDLSAFSVSIVTEPGDQVSWEYIPPGQWYLDNIYFDYYPDVAAAWERNSLGKSKADFATTHYNTWGKAEGRKSPSELIAVVGVGSSKTLTDGTEQISFSGQPILPRKTPYKYMFKSTKSTSTDTIEVQFYSAKLIVSLDPSRNSVMFGEEVRVNIQGAGLERVNVNSLNGLPGTVLTLDTTGFGFCVLVPTGSSAVTPGTYNWTFIGTVSSPTEFSVTVAGANFTVSVPAEIICNKSGIITKANAADSLIGVSNRVYRIYSNSGIFTDQTVTTPASGVATGFIVKYGQTTQLGNITRIFKDSTNLALTVTVSWKATAYNETITAGYFSNGTSEFQYPTGSFIFEKDKTFRFVINGTAPNETVQRSFTIYDNSGRSVAFGESAAVGKTGEYFFAEERLPASAPSQGYVTYTFKFTKSENVAQYEYRYGSPPAFGVTATSQPTLTAVTAQGPVNAYNPTLPILWTVTGTPGHTIEVDVPTYTSAERISATEYAMFVIKEGTFTHSPYPTSGFNKITRNIPNSGSLSIDIRGGETTVSPVLTQYQKDFYSATGTATSKFIDVAAGSNTPYALTGSIVTYTSRKLETAYKYSFVFKNLTTGAQETKQFWVLAYKYLNSTPGGSVNASTNDVHVLDIWTNSMNEATTQSATYSVNTPPGVSVFTIESSDTSAVALSTNTLTVNPITASGMYQSNPVTLTAQTVTADKSATITVKKDGLIVVQQIIVVKNNTAGSPNVVSESNPIIRFGILSIEDQLHPAFEVTSAATNVKVELTLGSYFPEVMPGSDTNNYISIYNGLPTSDEFGVDLTLRRGKLTTGVNTFASLFVLGTFFTMRIWVTTASASYTQVHTFTAGGIHGS